MEDPVLEIPLKTNPAIQMVAQWIANGGNGQHGTYAQKHVMGELRPPEGELEKKQRMEEIVRAPQLKASHAIPMAAQLTAFGDHGQVGELAQQHVEEDLKFQQG